MSPRLLLAAAGALAAAAQAADLTDAMRGAPITTTTAPPPLVNSDNSDIRIDCHKGIAHRLPDMSGLGVESATQ